MGAFLVLLVADEGFDGGFGEGGHDWGGGGRGRRMGAFGRIGGGFGGGEWVLCERKESCDWRLCYG